MKLLSVESKDMGNVWPVLSELYYDNLMDALVHGFHGEVYTDDLKKPNVVYGVIGWNVYLAGNPSFSGVKTFLKTIPEDSEIHANHKWEDVLKSYFKDRFSLKTRYQMDASFIELDTLDRLIDKLPATYHYKAIDQVIYNKILTEARWGCDFVGNFKDYEDFAKHGFGVVVMDGETVIAGTSSYIYFNGGYEIEIITREDYRGQGLGTCVAAHFIKETLKKGLIPHWDAAHQTSMKLAEKLGYRLKKTYTVYRID